MNISIDKTWDGRPVPDDETCRLEVEVCRDELVIRIDAPFHDDPSPEHAAGRCDRLWDYEVVELFLVGHDDHYLEIELGPHGHHLALRMDRVRVVAESDVPLSYGARVQGGRWTGAARIAREQLPNPVDRFNAFAIHGRMPRRYLAAHPVGGSRPDFHRIDRFPVWPPNLTAM